MPRTTLDIDAPVLEDLKQLQKAEGTTLGELASVLLAEALRRRREGAEPARAFTWRSQAMKARIDLEDKDALLRALDAGEVDP